MTRWAVLLVLLPGGLILWGLEYLRRRHAREHAADYVQAIQALRANGDDHIPSLQLPEVRDIASTVKRHRKPKKAVTKLRRVG